MFSRRIFVIAFALFTVTLNTACPADIAKQMIEQDQLRKEYQEKLDQADAIDTDLSHNYKVFIYIGPIVKSSLTWVTVSASDRQIIRGKLTKYIELMGRVVELQDHKAVTDIVASSTKKYHRDELKSAQDYMTSLNDSEK